jgi:mannose-6-phosphate isomerase-like protein (cupin superfamily)
MQTVIKKWGYELWIENNDLYCGKHLHVLPNKWCSVHYHKIKHETFYVISGELKLQFSKELDLEIWEKSLVAEIIIPKGCSFVLEPMTAHRLVSNLNYPCDFIEISTHHDDLDSYRLIESF